MKINQIKNTCGLSLLIILFALSVGTANAHSGRTDANGGHNCNVGSCAGTYHYHNGGSAPAPRQPYIPPTVIPTSVPTYTPTPTLTPTNTPTPTLEPTNTPTPVAKQAVEEVSSERNKGFWGFILSLFGF